MNNSTFIISKDKLKQNINEYISLGNVYYAVKANSNPIIINLINECSNNKISFLVNNYLQYKKIKNLKINNEKICLTNVLDDDLIKILYKEGVRFFTFDDLSSIKAFEKYADTKNVDISIRLSINECFNTFTYMGAETKLTNEILNYVKDKYRKIGISFYITEEFKHDEDSLDRMFNFIKNNIDLNYQFISIGGVLYNEDTVLSINKIKDYIGEVIIETGTGLLNNVIDLKISIIKNKLINNMNIFIIDNGIYSGFIDKIIYNKIFNFYIKDNKNKYPINNDGNKKIFIYGSSCDSKDYIASYYVSTELLEMLKERKYIYVENTGMYFEEFITRYNYSKFKYEII